MRVTKLNFCFSPRQLLVCSSRDECIPFSIIRNPHLTHFSIIFTSEAVTTLLCGLLVLTTEFNVRFAGEGREISYDKLGRLHYLVELSNVVDFLNSTGSTPARTLKVLLSRIRKMLHTEIIMPRRWQYRQKTTFYSRREMDQLFSTRQYEWDQKHSGKRRSK